MWTLTHQKLKYPVFSLPPERTQCVEELNGVGHVLVDGHQVQSCPRWGHANRRNIAGLPGVPDAAPKTEDVDKGCHGRVRDCMRRRQGSWQLSRQTGGD